MTINEMIANYKIQLHADGDKLQIPAAIGKKMSKADMASVIAAKPEIIAEFTARKNAEIQAHQDAAARLAANVPGLDILRNAIANHMAYCDAFNRMMEDEYNDGVNPPSHPTEDIAVLKVKYPVASAYIKAENWEYASHYVKSGAGRRAKQAITDGMDYSEALAQMEAEWSAHCEEHIWD